MSRLDELIAELCPNGVEYKTLGEVVVISRGVRVVKSQLSEDAEGKYPVYQNSMTPLGYFAESNCPSGTTFIISAGAAGEIGYSDSAFWAADDCCYFKCPENLSSRYLYHALQCQQDFIFSRVRKASVPRLARTVIEKLKIPLPPLEVQREIVRILDAFTELTAELTAELDARKKQYEYYSATILNFEDDVEYKSLIDVADIYDSLHQTPCYSETGFSMIRVQDINGGYINPDNTLKVSTEDYLKFTQKYQPRTNDIVVSRVGSYGRFSIIPSDFCCLGQNVALIHPKINHKYLYYILNSAKTQSWIANRVKGSNQKSLSLADIKRLPIPIISRVEQERIVSIFDRFDKLCNDITSGIPAEIEARRKQYEHYRDRLLTFKELGS